jgi:hypothetical protein
MKRHGIWLQAVSHRLVRWLISTWGTALVLLGTLALAGSGAVYLASSYDHQARVPASVPGTLTPSPAQ